MACARFGFAQARLPRGRGRGTGADAARAAERLDAVRAPGTAGAGERRARAPVRRARGAPRPGRAPRSWSRGSRPGVDEIPVVRRGLRDNAAQPAVIFLAVGIVLVAIDFCFRPEIREQESERSERHSKSDWRARGLLG